MKPVYQSRVGADGTCLAACVASILEISEAEVGDLYASPSDRCEPTLGDTSKRLAETLGITLAWTTVAPAGWSIGVGPSMRNPGLEHAVVCLDGKIVHDPSPNGPDCEQERLHTWGVIVPVVGNSGEQNDAERRFDFERFCGSCHSPHRQERER